MSYLVPKSFWSFPTLSSMLDEDDWGFMSNTPSGLSVSEDDKKVYVEASVPGVDPKDVDITYEKGVIRITASSKTEEKEGRKFWKRSQNEFSYQFSVPGDVDHNMEPSAQVQHGIVKLTFDKAPKAQPKKIEVKAM
jgi:HSP20 family protein